MKNFILVYINDGEYGKKGDFRKGFIAESYEEIKSRFASDYGKPEIVKFLEVAEGQDIDVLKPVFNEETKVYELVEDETLVSQKAELVAKQKKKH